MRRSLDWRRHWKLGAAGVAVTGVLLFALGGIRVAAVTSSAGGDGGAIPGVDVAGTVDLFDTSVVHSIQVTFDPDEYAAAIETFTADGEKVFIQADLVVDGTPVKSVGIRLKGNSTLMGLRSGGETVTQAGDGPAVGGDGIGRGLGGTVSVESPEDLPWLVSFDEFVHGQTYQGHEEIAVRPGGMGTAQTTALNEAVSLTLIALAGEPAEEAAYTAFSINGSEPALRLLVQQPDDSFVEDDLADDGVLYKALAGTSGGSFTYLGEDPLAYAASFRQVTGRNQQDLAPLIEFIRWVEESSDEEFLAGLEDRVDVESLARYLALHNLLLDFDDMSGPGQNYYLYFDSGTEKFTVLTWDVNATFTGDSARGPYDAGTMGGLGGMQRGEAPGGFQRPQGGALPEGFELPTGLPERPQGGALPEGFEPPEGMELPQGGQVPAGGGMGGHILKERFLATEEFQVVYEEAYRDLYQQLFADGAALEALDRWAAALATVEGDLVDAATLGSEVAQLRRAIEARTTALAENEVIAG
jgi:spore coat protein CotH